MNDSTLTEGGALCLYNVQSARKSRRKPLDATSDTPTERSGGLTVAYTTARTLEYVTGKTSFVSWPTLNCVQPSRFGPAVVFPHLEMYFPFSRLHGDDDGFHHIHRLNKGYAQ